MHKDPRDTSQNPSDVEQVLNDLAETAKQTVDAVNKRAGRDIFTATAVAFGILAVVVACLVWFNWGFVILAAAAVPGAQVELGRAIAKHKGVRIMFVPLMLGSALFIVSVYVGQAHPDWLGSSPWLWIIGLTLIAILLVRLRGPVEGYTTDVASTVFLLGYPCVLASALVLILAEPKGPVLIATFVAGIAGSDTGGYFMGVLIGKHPLSPRISPKKSWEGVIGSVLLSGLFLLIMMVFFVKDSWWKALVLAIVLVAAGILGDLVESVIKRDLGVKDMGTLLPGHGGLMDRLDSYILAAVPAWLAITWLFPHV